MVEKSAKKITGVVSGMFAGKTSFLIDICEKGRYAGETSVVFRPALDDGRFGGNRVTHDLKELDTVVFKNSWEIPEYLERYKRDNGRYPDNIVVLEAQFTDSGLISVLKSTAHNMGIMTWYDALNMTSEGDGFPFVLDDEPKKEIGELMQISDDIISPKAVCLEAARRGETKTEATRTQWKFWIYGPKTDALDVGGKEKYEARSIKHWQTRPYEGLYKNVIENADLEGKIRGYLLESSKAPSALVTLFENDGEIYARFASLRDMHLTHEGYDIMQSRSAFIAENDMRYLKKDQYSFLIDEDTRITGSNDKIFEGIDESMRDINNNSSNISEKEKDYIKEEMERSYEPLRER